MPMKTFMVALGALLTAGNLRADIYNGAKQQARNASGEITERENQAVANPSPSSPAPNAPAMDPVLQATLRNIANLRTDFAGLAQAADTNAAAMQKQMLLNDLAAAPTGGKPSAAAVTKLGDDLTAAVSGNARLRAQQPKLAQEIHAIFNSSHLTAAQQQMIFDDVQKMLQAAGVPAENVTSVVNDLEAIATATK